MSDPAIPVPREQLADIANRHYGKLTSWTHSTVTGALGAAVMEAYQLGATAAEVRATALEQEHRQRVWTYISQIQSAQELIDLHIGVQLKRTLTERVLDITGRLQAAEATLAACVQERDGAIELVREHEALIGKATQEVLRLQTQVRAAEVLRGTLQQRIMQIPIYKYATNVDTDDVLLDRQDVLAVLLATPEPK